MLNKVAGRFVTNVTFVCVFLSITLFVFDSRAQNWSTFGGQSSRSGASKITGPQNSTPLWGATSPVSATIGMAVYTFGDQFVTSRTVFSPYTSVIECRNLQNGTLVWTSPFISNTSILYAIGFTEDAVYAHDYDSDSLYALEPATGNIKWRSPHISLTFGAYPGCVFSCDGDVIVNGPIGSLRTTMRLDKDNGDTVWTNLEYIAIGPVVGLAANSSRVYRITGGIFQPIVLTAIDMETGQSLYDSDPIPGDPDQENPITLGPENRIYFWRDGGNLYAFEDVGNGLFPIWSYAPQTTTGTNFSGNISVAPDSTIYIFDQGFVKRLSHASGQVLNSSVVSINQGSISIGADGTVYVNNQSAMYYAFTPDLQTIKWQYNIGSNVYNNMALAKDGIMVLTAAGGFIAALQTPYLSKPVADFKVSSRTAQVGQPIDFFDQSSYFPSSWNWSFPGATITGASSQNPTGIVYNSAGIYEVELIVSNGFGSDSTTKKCYIEVVGTSGVFDEVQSDSKVFPNPSSGVVRLQTGLSVERDQLIVQDISGRTVLFFNHESCDMTLDLSSLDKGMYLIRFGKNLNGVAKILLR